MLYLADQETVGVMDLHSVPITGGAVTKLNPMLAKGQGTIVGADYEMHNPFRISPDSRYAVYVADQESDEVIELFVSELFGIDEP